LVSGDGSCFGKGSKNAPNVGMGKVSFAGWGLLLKVDLKFV
jgi:hypothetical protein